MVQAAAQAQAVVAAAKSRGDGLQPMTAAQIAALSQIQAQAIVHARKSVGTPQQIQTQIQLQAQALVHAHTQAQIQAGIYKGDTSKEGASEEAASKPKAAPTTTSSAVAAAVAAPSKVLPATEPIAPPAASTTALAPTNTAMSIAAPPEAVPAVSTTTTVTLTPAQMQQHEELKRLHEQEKLTISNGVELEALQAQQQQQLTEQLNRFRQQNMSTFITDGTMVLDTTPTPSSNSPQFLAQLHGRLDDFWRQSLSQIQQLENQTEQDFKNHNDLPLARIKRIMKSDEDVRMISAEAPVLFAKACELFILDLSIRAFEYSQLHKRRTLQKEDVKEAIQKTDIFDFLVDVIQ